MTPVYLIAACCGLLGMVMIIVHPRFLVRLFASVQRKRVSPIEETSRPAYAFDMGLDEKKHAMVEEPRVVSGGDLWKGWFLSRGRPGSTGRLDRGADPLACGGCDASTKAVRSPLAPPPHIRPLTSVLPASWIWSAAPFARFPHFMQTSANTSILLIIVVYLVFCIVAMTYKSDLSKKSKTKGTGEDFYRTGTVAMSQLPLVIALGVRGNIPGMMVGKAYDRLRILHKISGRVMFFTGAFHSIAYLRKWGKAGKLAKASASPVGVTGIVAFTAMCIIVVTSLPVVRRWSFTFFKMTHYLGIIMVLFGLGYHVEEAVPWVIVSAVIYAVSIIMGLCKTRIVTAEIQALGGTSTTLVSIPELTTGWRAGQHVRIRVMGLGALSTQCHPFTIASAPDTPGGMTLMVKAAGDWTSKLYEHASSGGDRVYNQDAEIGVWSRKARVIIEGPYGGLGNTLLPSFSSVVLVAGGSGITHSLALAEDLINRSPSGVVATRTIDLVWIVRVEQVARALMPRLNHLVARAKNWERRALDGRRHGADIALPTALRVHIFVTRVPKSSPLTLISPPRFLEKIDTNCIEKLTPTRENSDPYPFVESPTAMSHDSHEDDSDATHYGFGKGTGSSEETLTNAYASPTSKGSHDYHIRPELSGHNTLAERTKADWLARNPSTFTLSSLHQRQTDPTEPMSSVWAYRGRPDLKGSITTIVDETITRHGHTLTGPRGLFVTACGPQFMVSDARDACQAVTTWKRNSVNGVEFEDEFFGI